MITNNVYSASSMFKTYPSNSVKNYSIESMPRTSSSGDMDKLDISSNVAKKLDKEGAFYNSYLKGSTFEILLLDYDEAINYLQEYNEKNPMLAANDAPFIYLKAHLDPNLSPQELAAIKKPLEKIYQDFFKGAGSVDGLVGADHVYEPAIRALNAGDTDRALNLFAATFSEYKEEMTEEEKAAAEKKAQEMAKEKRKTDLINLVYRDDCPDIRLSNKLDVEKIIQQLKGPTVLK